MPKTETRGAVNLCYYLSTTMFRRRKARELAEQYDSVLFPKDESDSNESSIEDNGEYSVSSKQQTLPVVYYAHTFTWSAVQQPEQDFFKLINNIQKSLMYSIYIASTWRQVKIMI